MESNYFYYQCVVDSKGLKLTLVGWLAMHKLILNIDLTHMDINRCTIKY